MLGWWHSPQRDPDAIYRAHPAPQHSRQSQRRHWRFNAASTGQLVAFPDTPQRTLRLSLRRHLRWLSICNADPRGRQAGYVQHPGAVQADCVASAHLGSSCLGNSSALPAGTFVFYYRGLFFALGFRGDDRIKRTV